MRHAARVDANDIIDALAHQFNNMKPLSLFNLSSVHGRYAARKAGHDVPKYLPWQIKKQDFWELVKTGEPNECWPWIGKLNSWGYGRIRHGGIQAMSHRVAYQLKTGKNIDGLIAMHICDNPACCNPNHIALGTHADNQKDKFNKNRQAKGEINGQSILTEEQVIEARKLYVETKTTYKKLAEKYGVCKDTMQKAIRGIHWKHI